MKWKNLIKAAFQSIIKNRMRSFLTILGIVIGVGAVIALVSVGQGASSAIEGEIVSLGSNMIVVIPGSTKLGGVSHGAGSLNSLTIQDVRRLEKNGAAIEYVSPVINVPAQVIAGDKNWFSVVRGVSADFLTIRDWPLEKGAFFTPLDIRNKRKVAVLGKRVAEELFRDKNPVGARIRIRNIPFTVIGVLSEKGQSMMGNQDDAVFAPSTTVLYRMSDGRYVNSIYVSTVSKEELEPARREIRQLLRAQHNIKDGEDDDFMIRSQTDLIQTVSIVTGTLTVLLGIIAGVSLLVGGIGIMNIMLVSVTERTREIGIRMAVGARSGDILVQFLVEAVILCLLGGIIGILLGLGLGQLLSQLLDTDLIVDPFITIFAFLFSGAVGVFFGFYPARKASLLNPIEALHYE